MNDILTQAEAEEMQLVPLTILEPAADTLAVGCGKHRMPYLDWCLAYAAHLRQDAARRAYVVQQGEMCWVWGNEADGLRHQRR